MEDHKPLICILDILGEAIFNLVENGYKNIYTDLLRRIADSIDSAKRCRVLRVREIKTIEKGENPDADKLYGDYIGVYVELDLDIGSGEPVTIGSSFLVESLSDDE